MKKALLLALVITFSQANPLDFFTRMKGVDVVTNPFYKKACGECHFAYQPGLLPKRSWEKVMALEELSENHFGDPVDPEDLGDIEGIESVEDMDGEERYQYLLDYIYANTAETSWRKSSRKVVASMHDDEAPLRIREVRYLKRKHKQVPENLYGPDKKVKSLSQCNKCHTNADKGSFDDDEVKIPDYGKWERWFWE